MSPRQSAAVYRRRRIVVFGGLIVVLAALTILVWVLIARSWAGDATPPASPAASAPATTPAGDEATPDPDPSATPADGAPCTAGDVRVEAVTDSTEYASDQQPELSIALTNTSGTDCTINVGTATQVFTITSGSDVWWRSTDCQTDPSDQVVTLTADSTVTSATPIVWDRTRSSVETCESGDRPRAAGGGATYNLSVEIGGFPSAETVSFLLY